jgi:hypothetical protein
MKQYLFWFECGKCGTRYKSPCISDFVYGAFFLINKAGFIKYVNLVTDVVWDELKRLACIDKKMSTNDKANLMQKMFVLTCDSDSQGELKLSGNLNCVNCGSGRTELKGRVSPVEEIVLEEITHIKWNTLSHNEKIDLLNI